MRGAPDETGVRGHAAANAPPRAVFINLDAAKERRRFMEDQADKLGLVLERFPAVRAADIPPEVAERLNNRWERPLTAGELGCFLSHHTIWTEVSRGTAPVLVLEDDVMLSRRLAAALPSLARREGIDFLNLESFDRKRFVSARSERIGDDLKVLRLHRDKSGSAAYLIWPAGATKLLDRARRGAAPVDAFLHGSKRLVSWQVEPAMAMQLHVLERRGWRLPIPAASSIQQPRTRLPLTRRNLPFHVRRLATQLRLGGDHAMRLFGRRYRRIDVVDADFDHSRS